MKRKIYQQLLDWKESMKKFGEYMTTPTILHAADYKVEGDVTYLPLYMTPLL